MAETVFNTTLKTPIQPPPPEVNWQEFVKVVESRRSVRVYDGTPIPETVMRECLRLALLAPNSSNLQPWEFYWVRSPEQKSRLVKACLSQPAARTASELIVCVARPGRWREMQTLMLNAFEASDTPPPPAAVHYYRKLVPFAYAQGPMGAFGLVKKLILSCMGLFRPTPREPTSSHEMNEWAVKSTALACENLMLAFRAAGFDSCPMEGMDSARVRRLLQLPCDARIVMVISAGKRKAEGVYGPRFRFDEKLFLHEV
ncbi:MAG: nitroreductase family protein [Bdellovibrionales bacterium]